MATHDTISEDAMHATFLGFLRHHRWLFAGEGLVLMTLGAAAIAMPYLSTLAVELFVGWLIFAGGIMRIAALTRTHARAGFWWSSLAAITACTIGLAMVFKPFAGVVTLTVMLTILFLAEGLGALLTAFESRRQLSGWGWLVLNGLLNLVLVGLIWSGWPGTAGWSIGLLTGANLLTLGFSLFMLSLTSQESSPSSR